MSHTPINLQQKFSLFTDHWSPKVIAEMNDYQFKLVKIEGEFVWHDHQDTDEVFICLDGEMSTKGVEHKPVAESECRLMLIEPRGVVNTGEAGGAMTAENDVRI
jgi:mannose-6-phosphate isomerase-like protein (cupin superfamily)